MANFTSILDEASGPVPYQLTNDYLFRTVMQKNQTVLKGFVSALLHISEEEIRSLEIMNPIVLGEDLDSKEFILDLKILLNSNQAINIEVQVLNYDDWPERSLTYLCRAFDSLKHGDDYIDVLPTHHISILKFTLFSQHPEFYSTNMLMNVRNHQLYTGKFQLSVLDLNKIHLATEEDKKYQLDYWAALFVAKTWEDFKMIAEKSEPLKEAAKTVYAVSAEEDIRLRCEARRRYEEDRAFLITSGRKQGIKEGKSIGFQEGEAKLSSLITLLMEQNRLDDVKRVTSDLAYRRELYEKYNLQKNTITKTQLTLLE